MTGRFALAVAGSATVLLVACSSGDAQSAVPTEPISTPGLTASPTTPVATPVPQAQATPTPVPEPEPSATAETASSQPDGPFTGEWDDDETTLVSDWVFQYQWGTDFRYRTVHLGEIETIRSKDRIVPVDVPEFSSVSDAPGYMRPDEPVVSLVVGGHARAYPLAILMWHEIVNDTIGEQPVTVTYCPLCNTAIVFDRTVGGSELTFGTTGNLRHSDLVMWDRQTESWWQQITGEAIVGDFALTGTTLEIIPAAIVPWERFALEHPEGEVLDRLSDSEGEPLHTYDRPPYAGYDNSDRYPFAYPGEVDRRLVVTSRVLTLSNDENATVYPFAFLAENPVLNDVVDGQHIVAVFDDGTGSSFNDSSGDRQTAGSAVAFSRVVGDRTLTFQMDPAGMVDTETGTTWSLGGRALKGTLAGEQLAQVVHGNHFWFAVALFWPDTEIRDSLDKLVAVPGQD
ncbi:MAG: DUF3179 domain-containing protein [Dehalococcoidia bacterium]|nr:DUF3179 domain-containing protein [Dehalococcoidia bacterium]